MSDFPFPFNVEIPVSDFLRLLMGEFSLQKQNSRVYYHSCLPSLCPTPDGSNSRLVITRHVDDEQIKDLKRNIGRLYDVTKLFQLIFSNPNTHPLVHHSEICLWLLYEDWYACFVQGLMHWIPVDSSQTATLFAYGNFPAETEEVINTRSCSFPVATNAATPSPQPLNRRLLTFTPPAPVATPATQALRKQGRNRGAGPVSFCQTSRFLEMPIPRYQRWVCCFRAAMPKRTPS